MYKIINALQITPNKLFGVETYENIYLQIPFSRNIKRVRETHNLSIEKMSEILGLKKEDIEKMENGKLIPSDELLSRISEEFSIPKDALTENSVFERNLNEVKILEKIKCRNHDITTARNIAEHATDIMYTEKDSDTRELLDKVITSTQQAKHNLLERLKNLELEELIEVYKTTCDREMYKIADDII